MPAEAIPLLILGGTGRIGRALRGLWPFALRGGLRPVWQARNGRPGCLDWDILHATCPPVAASGVVLCLAGGRVGPGENTALALAALHAAVAQGARHVFLASSAAVYAPGPGPLHEDAEPNPPSAYGQEKLAMEQAAQAFAAKAGTPLTILRIGNVAGADALLGSVRDGPVRLDPCAGGPGGPLRSYIGPVTLAAVLGRLATLAGAREALPPILNIAAPLPVRMAALLDAAGLPWSYAAENPAAVPAVVLDTALMQSLQRLPPQASLPRVLVAEWQSLQSRA